MRQAVFIVLSVATILLSCTLSAIAANKAVVISMKKTNCDGLDEVLSLSRCWKDKNLGATKVATSSTDPLAYGDLYQWGRNSDGHQNRTSGILTATTSSYDLPDHSNFLGTSVAPHDWRKPKNDYLWQGLGGVNNPCPQGFRLPSQKEFEAEIASWSSKNTAGAFASPLKFVAAGIRTNTGTNIYNIGTHGFYWTSTVDAAKASNLIFSSSSAEIVSNVRGGGQSVRCIKE